MRRLIALIAIAASANAADFSFVVLGDIHMGFTGAFTTLQAHADWITANKTGKKIQGVFTTGDINDAYLSNAWHYSVSNHGFESIDGLGIPWGSVIGNHDYNGDCTTGFGYVGMCIPRTTSDYDTQVGYARIAAHPWFGGYWGSDPGGYKTNYYLKFTEPTTHRNFLVLMLEFLPRVDVITWATGIINANTNYEVIVVTHSYMSADGTLSSGAVPVYAPSEPTDYEGTMMKTWAMAFPNMRAIVAGHANTAGQYHAHRTDAATDGHDFIGIFHNYQSVPAPNSSQVALLIEFTSTTATFTNINTTTGVTDTTTYPAYTLGWASLAGGGTGIFPLPMSVVH